MPPIDRRTIHATDARTGVDPVAATRSATTLANAASTRRGRPKALTAAALPAIARASCATKPAASKAGGRHHLVAAVYTRYSTDMQTTSEGRQVADCRKYAGDKRFAEGPVFSDRGLSGTSVVHRESLQRMMEEARRHAFHVVVIEDLDRLSRHLPDLMAIFYELKLLGIELHDLQNGRLELIHIVMRGYMAEEGRVRFLALSKAGKRKAVEDGSHMAKVAYGHIKVEGETGLHAKHPVTAAVVEDIFRWIGEGVSGCAVARILTERGVLPPAQQLQADKGAPPARMRPWQSNTVLKIVRNHVYLGLVSWGRSEAVYDYGRRKRVAYEGTDPNDWIVVEAPDLKLVEPETWIRANLRVADDGHSGYMHLGRFLLTGKAVCCACGAPMTSATGAASKPAYVCSVANLGQTTRCTSLTRFRVDHLERAVVAKVNEEVLVPEALERLGRRFVAEVDALVGDDDRRRREIEARLARIDAMMKTSFEEAEDRGFTSARVVKLRRDWEEEAERLEAEQERLRRIEDCMAPLGSFEALREGIAGMLDEVPFRPRDAGGIAHAQALRDIIGSVRAFPPDGKGHVRVEIAIDPVCGLRRKLAGTTPAEDEKLGEGSVPGGEEPRAEVYATLVAGFDPEALRDRERIDRYAARAGHLAEAARDRSCDLTDAQWEAVAGLVADVDLVVDRVPVDPRTLVDGMVLFCIMGGPVSQVPERYGDPSVFRRAVKRLVYSLSWDRIAEALVEGFPDEFSGEDVGFFDTTDYPRRQSGNAAPVGAARDADRRKLLAMAAKLPVGDPVRLRYEAVAAILGGDKCSDTARALGLSAPAVYHYWDDYKGGGGIQALIPKDRKVYKETYLDAAQTAELVDIVKTGVHPLDDRFLTYPILVELCRDLYDVKFSRGGMSILCTREGVAIRAPTEAAKRRARLLATPSLVVPPSAFSRRGKMAAARARGTARLSPTRCLRPGVGPTRTAGEPAA